MGCLKTFAIVASVLFVGFAYFLYSPLPDGIAEPWKVRSFLAVLKVTSLLAGIGETLGIDSRINITRKIMNSVSTSAFTSKTDPLLEVRDTKFDGVPVRIYRPKSAKTPSPALVYFHGGGWTVGSVDSYDSVTAYTAKFSNIIVVSVEYRLAPEHPFPIPFDDCVTATLHLLRNGQKYGMNPNKIAVGGDSAGGNLAAAVALRLSEEPASKVPRLQFQWLVYPALQALDFKLPSFETNDHATEALLSRYLMARYWSFYILGQKSTEKIIQDIMVNNHTLPELKDSEFFRLVNYKNLPKKYHHVIKEPVKTDFGNVASAKEIEHVILDPYFSPLLAETLSGVAPAFIVTAEFDVLRDDGLLYAKRLREAGVSVVHHHSEGGFHGFLALPNVFKTCKEPYKILEELVKDKMK